MAVIVAKAVKADISHVLMFVFNLCIFWADYLRCPWAGFIKHMIYNRT